MTDTKALRELAEKSLSAQCDTEWFDYNRLSNRFMMTNTDAAFVVATKPSVVLALLDRIEELEKALMLPAHGDGVESGVTVILGGHHE